MMKKILLADDSITIRKVVGIIFAVEDYQLLTTGDGDSAYDMAITEKPDLVIADISMPGKNGFELCHAIKNNQQLSATSVLLLTGAFESFDEVRAAEVAADGWLIKPFESQALLDKVTQLLEGAPLRLAVADEVEAFTLSEEEDFFAADLEVADLENSDKQVLPDAPDTEELNIEDDDDVWEGVSFADENLKPQDILASTDEEEPEEEPFRDLDLSSEETVSPEDAGVIEDIENVDDDTSDDFLSADEIDADAAADELIEIMEDELAEEDSLVEDEQTFIGHAEDRLDTFTVSEEDDEEVLELTESDVITPDIDKDEPFWSGGDDESLIADEVVAETATNVFAAEEEPLSSVEATDQDDSADFVFQGDDGQTDAEELDFSFSAADDADESEENVTAVEDEQDFTFVTEPETTPVAEQTADEETPFVTPFIAGQEDSFVAAEEMSPTPESYQTGDQTTDQTCDQEPTSRQLEDQLAALSEDDLREIVERVAGPMIEKLAKEMLEQVVWEVVPDLAETLISAEIAKLKLDNS